MRGVVVLENTKRVWKAMMVLADSFFGFVVQAVSMHTPIPRPPAQNNPTTLAMRLCHHLREAMLVFVDPHNQRALAG